MKLSRLVKDNTIQELLINNNGSNNLSKFIKVKEQNILPKNNNRTIFNLNNNYKSRSRNYFGTGKDGSLFTTEDIFFESELDGPTVYKEFTNLVINSGHTVTTSNRCKGLVIYVQNDCIIDGALSMSARGANAIGEHFAPNGLDKVYTPDGIIDLSIGAEGGAGGARVSRTGGSWASSNGNSGGVSINGTCGGGGSGGCCATNGTARSGYGSDATTWSGGSGGGGCAVGNCSRTGYSASDNGGPGGSGICCQGGGSKYRVLAGGGAGNTGGGRAQCAGTSGTAYVGGNGTGGLLMLIVYGNLTINGIIRSNGSNGGKCSGGYEKAGGGASGGGSITILSKKIINNGTIQSNGGAGGYAGSGRNGGAGGAGSIRVHQVL